MATANVIERVSNNWDPIWMKLNEDFERQLEDFGRGDVKGKMLYTWDGNHRLRAWSAEIDREYLEEQTATDVSTVVEIGGLDQEFALVVGDIFMQCNSPSCEEEEAPMIAINPFSVSNIKNQSKIRKLLLRVTSRARQSFRVHGEKTKANCDAIVCNLPTNTSVTGILKMGFYPGIVLM
ncbi:hypothetical protein L7F22_040707 [Adiantum nelumboides]|nr:hypothetical protein [Adiantum nelumboides]